MKTSPHIIGFLKFAKWILWLCVNVYLGNVALTLISKSSNVALAFGILLVTAVVYSVWIFSLKLLKQLFT